MSRELVSCLARKVAGQAKLPEVAPYNGNSFVQRCNELLYALLVIARLRLPPVVTSKIGLPGEVLREKGRTAPGSYRQTEVHTAMR